MIDVTNLSFTRTRRMRKSRELREMVGETSVPLKSLIYPIFVEENITEPVAIKTMPDVFRIPEKDLANKMKEISDLGVTSVILFGVSHKKDPIGSDTLNADGLLARMIKRAKDATPNVNVIADICFCEYTDHGHCGVFRNGVIDNEATIEGLGKQAVIAAQAGADIVAPSSMMDGQVVAIRTALDAFALSMTPVMSYSTKFASSLYGPFREAGGTSLKGDRKTYQADHRNRNEAIRESLIDEAEGADFLMVKPGLHYLDLLRDIRERTLLPLVVYHVSGEYAMLKFASQHGAFDYSTILTETLTAFRRAGADLILTYSALDYARQIN